MGKTRMGYFNFINYPKATSILVQNGYPVYEYVDELALDGNNNIYLTERDTLYTITTNATDEIFLNANMSGFARHLTELYATDILNKQKINYHYVTNMHTTFANCYNLAGTPISAKRVRSMYGTYYNCGTLKGAAAVNANVNNLIGTYYNCSHINHMPQTLDNSKVLIDTYFNCVNLIGSPSDADKAKSLYNSYYNCYLISGNPANCNSAIITTNAYYNCPNIYGDFYWYNDMFDQADKINAKNMFYNRNCANKLNIWIKPETAIENALINYSDSFGNIYGAGHIDWTFFESTEGFDYSYYNNTLFNTNIILFFNKFLLGQFTPNDSFVQTDIKNNFPFGYGYYVNYVSLGSNSSYNYRYDFTLYKNLFNIVSTSSEVPEGYTLLGYWSIEGRKNLPKVFMKQTNERINYYSYSYRGRYYLNLFLNLKSIYVSLENLNPQEYWLPQNMNNNGMSFFQDILIPNSNEPSHIDYFSYFNNKNLQHINTAILKGGNLSNPVNPIISNNVIYLGKQYVPYPNSYLDAYYSSSGINYGWQYFKSFIQNNIIIEQVGNYIIPQCGINVATMDRTYEFWTLYTLPACGDNVKNMYGTYSSTKNCQKAIFGINVINAQNAYAYSDVAQNNIIFLGNNVIDIDNCFSGCRYLTHITQDDFAIDKCYHFNNTFLNCYNLIEFNAIHQSSSYQYKYSQHMFEDCHNLINFNSNFLGDSSVFYSGSMFMNCLKLFSCYFGDHLKVQRLESPVSMFYNCYNLSALDNHNDDTIYINYINGSMNEMFYNCSNLKGKIKINYGNILSARRSFSECSNLISINMPSYIANYANNRDIDNNRIFTLSNCSNLIELNLGGLKIARSLIIANCDNLINISTSSSFYPLNLSLQISNCNNLQDINSLFKNRKSYVSYSISLANLPQLNVIDMNPIGNNYGAHSFAIYNMLNLFIKNTTFINIAIFNNSIFYQNLLVDDDVIGLSLTLYQDYYVNNYSVNSFSNIEYIGNNLTSTSLYCYARNENSNIPFITTESNSFQKLIDFSKNLYSMDIQSSYIRTNLPYLFFLPNFTGENLKELQIMVNNIKDYYFNTPNFYYLNNFQNLSLPRLNIISSDNQILLPNSLSISKINLKNNYLEHLIILPGGYIFNNINNKAYSILNFLNNSFTNVPRINILEDSISAGAFYLHNTLPYNSLVPYFDMTLGLTANHYICRGSLPVAILLSNTSQSSSPLFHYHLTNLLSDKDIRYNNLYIANIFYYKYSSTNFFNNNYYNEANLYQLFGENIYNCNIYFTNVRGYDFNQYNFNLTYTNYYCNSLSDILFKDDDSFFSIILPFIMYDNISDNGRIFGDTEWIKTKEIIDSYSNSESISPYNILFNSIGSTNNIAVLEYNWLKKMSINEFNNNNTISNRQIITYKEQWSNSAKNLNVIFYYRHMSADYALT